MTAREIAERVLDPELPMLTIADLGILRDVVEDAERVTVDITPTYSGCPAMGAIRADITARLHDAGYADVNVRTVLRPPWTTDWITAEGRHKLAEHGIAPPPAAPAPPSAAPATPAAPAARQGPVPLSLGRRPPVTCPRCGEPDTVEVSRFGATACKALHRCPSCGEPFESVKAI